MCTWRKNGNSLQYSCLGNPMDKAAWQATVQGVTRVRHDLEDKQQRYMCKHMTDSLYN